MQKDCAETCRFPTGLQGFEEGHFSVGIKSAGMGKLNPGKAIGCLEDQV